MNLLYRYILLLALCSAGSTSFLIYNEDHNKCVNAVSATVVQMASCDISSKAQHFQWISSSQIINILFELCLGAENIEKGVKIILLPCNKLNPVQTWECKNENLFGLKGQPLHLNYGHRYDENVLLHEGSGVWSHWLIYRTKENLCSRGVQDLSVLNITVYRQMDDTERVIVMCNTDKTFHMYLKLSVKSEQNYTMEGDICSPGVCVFTATVSPPASFTCVHEYYSEGEENTLHSETYSWLALDHHDEGISHIYLFSTIAVGLIIVIMAVIVNIIIIIIIRCKAKDPISPSATDNHYMNVQYKSS